MNSDSYYDHAPSCFILTCHTTHPNVYVIAPPCPLPHILAPSPCNYLPPTTHHPGMPAIIERRRYTTPHTSAQAPALSPPYSTKNRRGKTGYRRVPLWLKRKGCSHSPGRTSRARAPTFPTVSPWWRAWWRARGGRGRPARPSAANGDRVGRQDRRVPVLVP